MRFSYRRSKVAAAILHTAGDRFHPEMTEWAKRLPGPDRRRLGRPRRGWAINPNRPKGLQTIVLSQLPARLATTQFLEET